MKRRRPLREWASGRIAENPQKMVLLAILLLNVFFISVSACVISALAPSSLEYRGFWASVFYTVTMILDAGCIQFVVADVGQAGVAVIVVCLVVVIIGMITFTGAVIGYVTNSISNFIEHSSAGNKRLYASGHTAILNWNNRAAEIVNDLLYTGRRERVVVLSDREPALVRREIAERLRDTVRRENAALRGARGQTRTAAARRNYRKNRLRDRISVIVRQGDAFSSAQLRDISLERARTVIILGGAAGARRAATIKTLITAAEITAAESSADRQKLVVEAEDGWTASLARKIIEHKERLGKCNITAVEVDRVLGQLLSQFCIMPELNQVYSELLSNKGASFFSQPWEGEELDAEAYLRTHERAVPLRELDTRLGRRAYFLADREEDLAAGPAREQPRISVRLDPGYRMAKKNVVLLGHDGNIDAILDGFEAFRREWNPPEGGEILNLLVIDSARSIARRGGYGDRPYVSGVVAAETTDRDAIVGAIRTFADQCGGGVSILLLSDDQAEPEELDADVLTYLVYIQDVITERGRRDRRFDRGGIDVIAEIVDPRNFDVARGYNADNIIISSRYISRMITQIGEKEALFDFYQDILTFDDNNRSFLSRELYVKEAGVFFARLPEPCQAGQLIRAVYEASPADNRQLVLGVVTAAGETTFFCGDRASARVALGDADKLIVFACH